MSRMIESIFMNFTLESAYNYPNKHQYTSTKAQCYVPKSSQPIYSMVLSLKKWLETELIVGNFSQSLFGVSAQIYTGVKIS